jgi:hypothetical protein
LFPSFSPSKTSGRKPPPSPTPQTIPTTGPTVASELPPNPISIPTPLPSAAQVRPATNPTPQPSLKPIGFPTPLPSHLPTEIPTKSPTIQPTPSEGTVAHVCTPRAGGSEQLNDFYFRGTSLGGWLVLQPWITPSLFYQFLGASMKWGDDAPRHVGLDTLTFCRSLGKEEANKQLRRHWNSWVTEEQISSLHAIGVETVKIPVGDWMYVPYEPYIGCTVRTTIKTRAGCHPQRSSTSNVLREHYNSFTTDALHLSCP